MMNFLKQELDIIIADFCLIVSKGEVAPRELLESYKTKFLQIEEFNKYEDNICTKILMKLREVCVGLSKFKSREEVKFILEKNLNSISNNIKQLEVDFYTKYFTIIIFDINDPLTPIDEKVNALEDCFIIDKIVPYDVIYSTEFLNCLLRLYLDDVSKSIDKIPNTNEKLKKLSPLYKVVLEGLKL
ncbi:hypothetical protein [Desnuesiella massiliensis]|uniref:hypothetical protein n=1 Tax=Desnuesiella massiliensis TaxID=1650662 RepID=UPI0006E132B8|nr:hypothetical protein [Desnuesiella massiliensis]